LASKSEVCFNSHVLSMQGIEHSQVDKSQHAQLVSTDQVAASPTAEEDEGVETSTPPPHFETTSHNQLPSAPGEDVARDTSVGDNDLDDRADQYILALREDNARLDQTNIPSEKLPTEVMPTTNTQSAKIISQEDFDQLEKANPLDSFYFLAQDVLFSKSTEKSSNVSADDASETSKENLLAEFRSKVLEANLFEALEQDENIIAEVKELLCKLGNLLSGSKFQEFSRVLEPLLEGIGQFQHKRTDQAKLEEKTLRCDQLLDEVAAFKAKVEVFREKIPTNQQKVAEIDSTIAKYKAEILNFETQKNNLLAKENLMKQEAQVAIQKAKDSKLSQQEIAVLTENGKVLDERLSDFKNQLDKLTSEFVILKKLLVSSRR